MVRARRRGPLRLRSGRARLVALLAAGCLAAACGGTGQRSGQPPEASHSPREPSGVRLTVHTPDGEPIAIEGFRGSRLLLFFFTTYDIASQVEMERLTRYAAGHPEFKIVGIALQPNAETLLGLYEDYLDIPFPVAHDPTGRVMEGLSDLGLIPAVPSFILLDEKGRAVARHTGATTAEVLGALVEDGR